MKMTGKGFGAVLLLVASVSIASATPPRLFFTDLESGPNTGGENNNGAYVTLYGTNLGTSATVTVGGGPALVKLQPSSWLWYQKMTIQLGPGAATGNIVVSNANGTSNGLPFTVRAGNIFFVSTTGNDANNGSFATPWRTIPQAKNNVTAGGIAYIMDGVIQSAQDNFSAAVSMDINGGNNSGTAGNPKALVAYPGATVTIGTPAPATISYALRTPNIGITVDHWVIAGIHFIGPGQTIDFGGDDWRIIGNDLTCPNVDGGQVGCFEGSGATHIKFFGNHEHNSGPGAASIDKQFHSVYFSTDSNSIEVGWNTIENDTTFRGLQFHSSPLCIPACGASDTTGHNQFDLHVHDNLIHDNPGDGINFATVDPSKGVVEAYNNVIYNVGLQDPVGGGGAFNCIYAAGITNTGSPGGGTVQIYNNTLSNCGPNNSANAQGGRGAVSYGNSDGSGALTLNLRNNTVYQDPGEIYINGLTSHIIGTNNLWFGIGNGPATGFTSNVNADPLFVNRTTADFHLQAGSPAIGVGVNIAGLLTDHDGVVRPQAVSGLDTLGAYELNTGAAPPPPPAPMITSSTTASGTVGTTFTYQIAATNSPTSYTAAGLPSGLSVNINTGLISGTPVTAATSTITLGASNAGGTGNATLTLTINPSPIPTITSSTTTFGTAGIAFSYQITATQNPTSFNATGLPLGLSVNTTNGLISGTPTSAGTSSVALSATNSGGTGTATLTVTITATPPPPPVITSTTTASGTVGTAFSYQITATNNPTTFSATGLPAGLSINTTTGLITGTPTTAGISNMALSAGNSGGTGSATLTLTVNAAPPPPTLPAPTLSLPSILPVNATLNATYPSGFNVSFVWTVTAATPPPGAPAAAPSFGILGRATSGTLRSASPSINLGSMNLTPGFFSVSVQAVDNTTGGTSAAAQNFVTLVASNLSSVRVFPNPWRADRNAAIGITFDTLALNSSVKIFTLSGRWVKTLPTSSSTVTWDLTNDSNEKVASGLYIYAISSDTGKATGKLAIIK